MKVNAISFQAFNNTNKNKINHKDSTSQDFCVTQNALNSNHIYIPNFKAINRVQVEKKLASFNLGLQFIRNNPNILNNLKENKRRYIQNVVKYKVILY